MRIQHNVTALNAYRNLRGNNVALSKNLEKLSSGYRINRAGDDAAGLAVSEKMRAQIRGLETAEKNAQDGISLVQTAEGALTEVHGMLNRMVELATQSANGTYDNEVDRANLQKEVASLKKEIDRISEASNYNGIKLLDGSLGEGAGKTNLPNVTVNGVTGQAATGGVDAVIEVKSSEDWKFGGSFDIATQGAGVLKFTANNTEAGSMAHSQIKYSDAAGNETIIDIQLTCTDKATGKVSGKVTVNGAEQEWAKVGKGVSENLVGDNTALAKDNLITATAKILGNIEEFSELFTAKAVKDAGGAVITKTDDAKFLRIDAKEAGAAEVKSVLTNTELTAGEPGNITIKDTALSNTNEKIQDQITVHGAKMFGVGGPKTAAGAAAAVTIEEQIKTATIEVDGEKFLFANKALKGDEDFMNAVKAAGIKKENILYSEKDFTTLGTSQKMEEADAKAMVKLINKAKGEKVASLDNNGTDILFNGSGKSENEGLVLQIGDTADKFNKMSVSVGSMSTRGLNINNVDVSSQDGASASIKKIKDAINSVSSTRGDLGALQNRLEHTISNLGVMTENITDAESRIRDTDMAKEMMAYTKNNILVQASQAMLAQANQIPQGVLQLLG